MEEKYIRCIKCKNSKNNEGSEFCFNCGFPLDSNFCTEDNCQANDHEAIRFPENYCYCNLCGSPTVYFEEKLIEPETF
ncbi:MAG: hypothetical protein LKF42_09795 [Streptococcaceae bacterium]|jgi:hypothetical protein|nr:hypothetical protein [Streptococcaceae bacterium]